MPTLDKWISKDGGVGILGDAAHAVPPTTGQGVNQALEDSSLLAVALAKVPEGVPEVHAMAFWEETRKKRVYDLMASMVGKGGQISMRSTRLDPTKATLVGEVMLGYMEVIKTRL